MYKKACAEIAGSGTRRTRAPEEAASELITHPELFGKFKLTQPPVLGRDIDLILTLANLSAAPKTVTVNLSVSTVLYTRAAVKEILKEATTVSLGSKEGSWRAGAPCPPAVPATLAAPPVGCGAAPHPVKVECRVRSRAKGEASPPPPKGRPSSSHFWLGTAALGGPESPSSLRSGHGGPALGALQPRGWGWGWREN